MPVERLAEEGIGFRFMIFFGLKIKSKYTLYDTRKNLRFPVILFVTFPFALAAVLSK